MTDPKIVQVLLELTDILAEIHAPLRLGPLNGFELAKRIRDVRTQLLDSLEKGKHQHATERHAWADGHYVFSCVCGATSTDGTTWVPS